MNSLKKILFVDDDVDILTVCKFSLAELSELELLFENSGEGAIKRVLTEKPDLIVLDVMMPGMDGLATLQVLKLIPTSSSIPVIFLTAKAQKTEIDQYLSLGIIDLIIKPFDPLTFKDRILNIWASYSEKKN